MNFGRGNPDTHARALRSVNEFWDSSDFVLVCGIVQLVSLYYFRFFACSMKRKSHSSLDGWFLTREIRVKRATNTHSKDISRATSDYWFNTIPLILLICVYLVFHSSIQTVMIKHEWCDSVHQQQQQQLSTPTIYTDDLQQTATVFVPKILAQLVYQCIPFINWIHGENQTKFYHSSNLNCAANNKKTTHQNSVAMCAIHCNAFSLVFVFGLKRKTINK